MKQATYDDAAFIAGIYQVTPGLVWSIIKGMSYTYYSQLTSVVARYLLENRTPNN